MSHTLFVKFPGFKHASQENYLALGIGFIFSDKADFAKFFQYSEQAIL